MNIVQATGIALILLAAASHSPAASAAAPRPQKAAAPAERHFDRAAEAFAKKAYVRAAHQIRLGERFVARQADHATGAAHKALHASAVELSTLANSVQRGAVKDARVLRKAFARAERALGA